MLNEFLNCCSGDDLEAHARGPFGAAVQTERGGILAAPSPAHLERDARHEDMSRAFVDWQPRRSKPGRTTCNAAVVSQ
jgi:hypothetical protein